MAVFNMALGQWVDLVTPGGTYPPGSVVNNGIAQTLAGFDYCTWAIWVPTWGAAGQIIRHGTPDTGGVYNTSFWIYDLSTNTNIPYTPQGVAPTAGTTNGRMQRLMPQLGLAVMLEARKTVAITNPAIYVMRYA